VSGERRTSVIIPVYNTQAYLRDALDSIAAQTRPVKEVIILDDGSREPVRLPKYYKDLNIRVYRTTNQGLPSARNVAATLCTGEYLALLDSDDAWHPNKIALQEEAMLARPEAPLCFTKITYIPPQARSYRYPSGCRVQMLRTLWERNYIFPSTAMIRRSAWLRCGGEESMLWGADDWELWWRLARLGPFVFIPEPLTYYRRHPEQMTRKIYKMSLDICRAKPLVRKRANVLLERIGLHSECVHQSMREFENGFYDYITYHEPRWKALPHLIRGAFKYPSDFHIWKLVLRVLIPDRIVRQIRRHIRQESKT